MSMTTELIKGLRNMALQYSAMGVQETEKIMKQAANVIEELSAKVSQQNIEKSSQYYNDGWIPCDDKLPEDEEAVLVSVSNGIGVLIGRYIKSAEYWKVYGTYGTVEVDAWQPLPPIYKPEEG